MKTKSMFAAMALIAHVACGQVILEPKPGEFLKPAEWQPHPIAQVGQSQEWLVSIRFRLTSREPGQEQPDCYVCESPSDIRNLIVYNDPFPNRRMRESRRVHVRSQWFTIPFVERSGLQDVDLRSLKSDLQIDNSLLTIPARTLAFVPSMQRELGWLLDAGNDDSFGWNYSQLDIQFAATIRNIKYRREELARFPAPTKWPDQALGTFEPQVYLDFAPQPNGFVQPISDRRITEMVQKIANLAGVDPKRTPVPSEVAFAFSKVVFGTLRNRENVQTRLRNGRDRVRTYGQTYKTSEPRPPIVVPRPPRDPDTFAGLPVRDIINVWKEGVGTEPERCAVLVAALRKFNIPARVMIGVELDESDLDEAIKPRSGFRVTETTTIKPATGPDDPCPNMPETATISGVISSRPATIVSWVEFAVFDQELQQLIWVPIDPGSGNNSWKFGTLDNAEHIIALATNFWPKDIQYIGREPGSVARFGYSAANWEPSIADWHLQAGLFGMQSATPVYSACAVEWRVTGRKASQREIDEFRSVERVPYTKEAVANDSTGLVATPNTAKPTATNQTDKPKPVATPSSKPAPAKKSK